MACWDFQREGGSTIHLSKNDSTGQAQLSKSNQLGPSIREGRLNFVLEMNNPGK
jgi:hypothetical protein